MTDHAILQADRSEELEDRINRYTDNGWELRGNIVTFSDMEGKPPVLLQLMYRRPSLCKRVYYYLFGAPHRIYQYD